MSETSEAGAEYGAARLAGTDGADRAHIDGAGAEGADPGEAARAELISAVELIEAQPLEARARGYEQLHEQLLAELQRSDGTDHAAR